MAQSTETDGYELYAVCAAVSIGSKPYVGEELQEDGLRSITIMDQPGTADDPYGGHKQREILADVEVSGVPDGTDLGPEDHPAYGYDTAQPVAVYVKDGDGHRVATVAWHEVPQQ